MYCGGSVEWKVEVQVVMGRGREKEKPTDRQTDKQTERQTERQLDKA